jgi:5-methylcytosine-specific restriction enzyme subunit McrC
VWLGTDSTAWAVVDAKYKAERPEGFPDADLYQMLAYCTVLGLAEGHLVYAKGNEPVMSHQIRRAGVTIHATRWNSRCHPPLCWPTCSASQTMF